MDSIQKNIIKYDFWDYTFIIWFVTNACFNHSLPGMIGQVIFVLYSLKKCAELQSFKRSKIFAFYLLFCFVCWYNIHSGHALSKETANFMLNVVSRNFVFMFFVFQYLRQLDTKKIKNLLLVSFVLGSLGMLVVNFLSTGTIVMRDVEGALNGNGQAVNDAIILGWMLYDWQKPTKQEIIASLILVLFIVLSGTRKAILVVVIIGMVGYMLKNPSKIFSNSFKAAIGIAILLFVLFKVQFVYDIIGNRLEGLFSFIDSSGSGEIDGSTEVREHFIELGTEYFLLNPWHGYGIDCFREIPGSYGVYAHNNYVELMFDVGLPGVISYYLMYFISMLVGVKNYLKERSNTVILGLTILLACLFADYAMVSYFDRITIVRIILCYFLVAGIFSQNERNCSYNT